MLLRKLVVVGLVGFVSLAANIATAEDAVGPSASFVGAEGVSFADSGQGFGSRFDLSIRPGGGARFSALAPAERPRSESRDRNYEFSVVASAANGFDVAFAQRGGVGFNDQGDIDRQSRGSEVRLGRGLRDVPRDQPSRENRWYVFAASEDEALIWRPGAGNLRSSSGFALQDRVEIGDLQAGVTYETNGWQASIAYVEREVSVRSGGRSFTEDENFAGVTLTMRR